MYRIATHWVQFLPRIHKVFPQMMAEMHGYSTAAAHLKLPHQLLEKFMFPDVQVQREGWIFFNNVMSVYQKMWHKKNYQWFCIIVNAMPWVSTPSVSY